MLLRRRRPTLEVHVPISPTATFLNMANYLVRSLRKNGGRYREAPIVLTAGAERPDIGLAERHPWLHDNGVELRWVDEERFARYSWWATGCERFRHATDADVFLALGADTLIAGPLDEPPASSGFRRVLLADDCLGGGSVHHVTPHLVVAERDNRSA